MAFFQQPPTLTNPFASDRVLQSILRRLLPTDVLHDITPSLHHMGELASGTLWQLANTFRHDEPRHTAWDPWGNRIDHIAVSGSWQQFAPIATQEGLINTAYARRHGAFSRVHQMALVYLFAPSTQVYTCPLAMTDGCARSLEVLAQHSEYHHARAVKEWAFPRLTSRDPRVAWTSGQWMTERTGGSDVGLSETIATPITPHSAMHGMPSWQLHGVKWFTSAITADVALTLARPQGNPASSKGLALFFVTLRDASGQLQNITVNRLKDKLGTRHVPTAELTLSGTPAVPLAGLSDGVRTISAMLNITRTWNAVCSVAFMRRALSLARDYAHKRVAFGAPLSQKPLHLDTLATLAAEYEAAMHLTFHAVALLGREETNTLKASEKNLLSVLQPLTKLFTAKLAVAHASEVLEAFGGAGYVEDTGLPELLRDAQVLPIWEGTTNVLALETYRALRRDGSLQDVLHDVIQRADTAKHPRLQPATHAVHQTAARIADFWERQSAMGPTWAEANARHFAMTMGRTMALALLIEHAQWALDTVDGGPSACQRSLEAACRFLQLGIDRLPETYPDHQQSSQLALASLASLALDGYP